MIDPVEFLKSRRSIRKFKDSKPPLELVLKALDVARYAPSAKNSQPWRFIIIDDRELLNKLSYLHPGAKPLESAPLAIAVVCNIDESPVSYMVDCANATTYLLLALHALGLGSVWIQTLRNIDELKKVFDLPENIVPIALIAIGYPDETPVLKQRRSLSEITFLNKYGNRLDLKYQ
ncbi:MAG: nitroreductase family protein [Desulfurococcaceae archaeon]|uniref:Nitroreductase family protein n=1 Tax=Staphylothermus marinus TaxID=2280 RepID=A0A7C4D858_STAMA